MIGKKGVVGKKGAFNWKKTLIILGAVLIIALILWAYLFKDNCTLSKEDTQKLSEGGGLKHPILWSMVHILGCGEDFGFFGNTFNWIKTQLGFNQTLYDFVPDLIVGALAGFWIWIVFVIANLEGLLGVFPLKLLFPDAKTYLEHIKKSWLGFVGGSLWKIIPIAVGYGVLMQIPFINSAFRIITLEPLLNFTYGSIWSFFLKSLILAMYIGFLPAAIEAYTKYKIRTRYSNAIEREKAFLAIQKQELKK